MNVLLLTAEGDLPERDRVWGGANLGEPPRRREALTWLTLVRLLGWRETIVRGERSLEAGDADRCVVVARDPDSLGVARCDELAAMLERRPGLVVARAARPGTPLSKLAGTARSHRGPTEGALAWSGPGEGRTWSAHAALELDRLEGSVDGARPARWASVGEQPLAVARRVGRGVVLTLAAHPSELAAATPAGTGLLAHLLRWGAPAPAAWLDLERTVVLRMDDPGSSASAHLDSWAHPLPSDGDWSRLADDLAERQARLSIGYVAGWVDDGDPARGTLEVGGERVERLAGTVHPSRSVVYRTAGGLVHDHPAELRAIRDLRDRGLAELEVHGHTHVRPDPDGSSGHARWADAPDRHLRVAWYRELEGFEQTGAGPDPVEAGSAAVEGLIGRRPTTLACPGQACSPAAAECALDAGLELVAAETLALRCDERLAWSEHLRSPYADGADGPWLESGVPVVACLHDRDVAGNPRWLADRLDEWLANGCRRFWDLRQLAAALALRVSIPEAGGGEGELRVEAAEAGRPSPLRPVPILARRADGRVETTAYEPDARTQWSGI